MDGQEKATETTDSTNEDVVKSKEIREKDEKESTETSNNEVPKPDVSFKTPSFIIPSKKKIQGNVEASQVFKQPAAKPSDEKSKTIEPEKIKESEKTNPEIVVVSEKVKSEKPSRKGPILSPAEQLKAQSAVPYKEPPWSTLCEQKYGFEVIKNGAVIDNISLSPKPFHIIGRIPSCDIPMEHPSLSRYHAVIQYSGGSSEEQPQGWYLYDLDSTHGTWINKHKVPAGQYHRIHVDYVLKFGGSTRLFIMQGPDDDRMEESELSVSEMKEQRDKQLKETELIRQAELEEAERKAELMKRKEDEKGCSWGIDEDAEEEEEEEGENPYAKIAAENEQLYIDDPKKSLNGYFEREGHDPPEYEFAETGYGKWKCWVELPIDSPTGEPMRAEVVVTGKKKDAVVACALEACRTLDRLGELRKATHESRRRKQKNWEDDDFYDSDEDVYLDRTGTIEKKREFRKAKIGKTEQSSDTYDSLMDRHKKILAEIEEIDYKLEQAKSQAASLDSDDVDALDAYMSAIKSGMMDTKTKMKLKRRLMELKQEEQKVRKLVNIAKPASLPELTRKTETGKQTQPKTSILAGVGKIKGPTLGRVIKKAIPTVEEHKMETEDVVEEEEEEDDEEEEVKETVTICNKGNDKVNKSESKTEIEGNLSNKAALLSDNKKSEQDRPSSDVSKSETVTTSIDKSKTVNTIKAVQDSGKKVKGPSMPLAAVLAQLQNEKEIMDSESGQQGTEGHNGQEGASKRKLSQKASSSKKARSSMGSYDSSDPEFAGWIPPDSQSGDGKTHLNAKFGY